MKQEMKHLGTETWLKEKMNGHISRFLVTICKYSNDLQLKALLTCFLCKLTESGHLELPSSIVRFLISQMDKRNTEISQDSNLNYRQMAALALDQASESGHDWILNVVIKDCEKILLHSNSEDSYVIESNQKKASTWILVKLIPKKKKQI